MESENRLTIKDNWIKMDSNFYRILNCDMGKIRQYNFALGLGIGIFIGGSYTLGCNLMLAYPYYSKFMYYFTNLFPLFVGIILIVLSLVSIFLVNKKDDED